ncbi:serine hydrolase domain-containing protein [Alteromonas sp. C1M14]|uniref:serine hydrolase domain-containing protein n=1 Tax=Alteromonas sp. C1M14 TaxID=2841567 RepID=UPI001C0A30EF|nr:serine hydrolase domain-containing protein [Alteromonas sp. C1M14]MBU2977307.1 beta-lactamase family protein [Alteromonas sp. C1M14]
MFRPSLFVLLLAGLGSHPASAALSHTQIQQVDGLLQFEEQGVVPGCAAGVFKEGQGQYVTASGYSNLAEETKINGDTRFYAGSLSKQFTALGIMKLVERGKLSLSDPLTQYFPEMPDYAQNITVNMLIHHISGIRDGLGLIRLAGVPDLSTSNLSTALKLLALQQHPDFEPGTHYAYSNGGYLLLAGIIEQVSKMPFSDYMRQAVLEPMGMTQSFFVSAPIADGFMAQGYLKQGSLFKQQNDFPSFSGSGGLITSINELGKYEYDLAQGHKVWTDKAKTMMLSPATFNDGSVVREQHGLIYAGGIKLGIQEGKQWMMHTGASSTFKSAYGRLVDSHYSIIVLCNRNDGKPATKLAALADVVATSSPDNHQYEGPLRLMKVAPKPSAVPPAGSYYSGELDVTYLVAPVKDGADVTIISAWPGHPQPAAQFRLRYDENGVLRDGINVLEYDPQTKTFAMKRGRIHGIVFTPVSANG